ncbi:TetR/AcrR family transcriptional regulator [Pseudodesulfovibrio sp.]|uniref:TetR/AcrR family transcriptional regulator n=1 Tax=unclassified Pseudodesulfovibrio TaxID=2661612 RepID=UPI003B0021E7
MVQVLKEHVRERIEKAAEARFAKSGFASATMGEIAADAGVATGTVYKYFPDKQSLFQAIIPETFVAEMTRLTRIRIASFASPGGMDAGQEPLRGDSGDLLDFFAGNRLKVVILLGRGEGTAYAEFTSDYVREMEDQTLKQAGDQFPGLEQTAVFRFMVRSRLEESVRGIVSILEAFEDIDSIREAFSAAMVYQIAGINALVEWGMRQGERA